jgi:hypothetical protein
MSVLEDIESSRLRLKMEIAKQVAKYEEKGFSRERAEIHALMENGIRNLQRFP